MAELRDAATGAVVGESLEPVGTADWPDLPDELAYQGEDRWLDVGSVGGGSTRWRVLVTPVFEVDRPTEVIGAEPAFLVVVAAPTTGVRSSLGRLEGAFAEQEATEQRLRQFLADASRSDEGAGLGLSIVAAVAAEHGGRVEVANADGGGATFTLRLPLTTGD